jgi:hypothetical protein
VTYKALGTAPYRSFVVTWSQMKEWNSGASLFYVQMILYESGDFIYQYKDIANIGQGSGQVGWQLSMADYDLVDLSSINSLAYSAIRFFKPTAPIVEYRFDQCGNAGGAVSGANTVLDSSAVAPSLPGTPSGTIISSTSSGKLCTGFNFNGAAGTYVSVPHNAKLNQPYVSVAAWVRHSAAAFKNWEAILAKGDSTYRLHLNGGCSINGVTTANAFTFGFNGGCGNADLNSGVVPVAGQWYHVVGTYDGATIKIFVNGVLQNSQSLATTIGTNAFPLYLGENSQATGRNWSGDIDEIKVFDRALPDTEVLAMYNNEVAGVERNGALRSCTVCGATLGNFNAFETNTAAGAVAGWILTKIAGQSFATGNNNTLTYVSGNIDVVALSGGALTSFGSNTNTTVQFLDARDNSGAMDAKGCRSSWTVIASDAGLAAFTLTFPSGQSRVSLPTKTPVNSWPEVRIKIINASTPANYGCSNDAFAIRPAYINTVGAPTQDLNWQTAGNTRSLTNVSAAGGNVHAAGKPFSISGVTARNAANATTTNYTGSPTLVPGSLVLPDPDYCTNNGFNCIPGVFTAGTVFSGGVLSTSSANYSDVGTIGWELEDRTFANVDAADSTKKQRYPRSNAYNYVGRFVPASFQLNLNAPQLRTACAAGGFTYLGQGFGYVVVPSVVVKAMNGAATPLQTSNYLGVVGSGGIWTLATPLAYSSATCTAPTQTCALLRQSGTTRFTSTYALGTATPGWDGSNLATQTGTATIVSANDGTGTLAFGATDKLVLNRSATTPQAPYTAAVTLALQLDDYSESGLGAPVPATTCATAPTIAGNPTCISGALAATAVAFDSANPFRYGRLRLSNAYGSDKIDLAVPFETQYWNGSAFVKNAQDSCTALAAGNIALGNKQGGLAAYAGPIAVGAIANGAGTITLTKPAAATSGSVDLVAVLGSVGIPANCGGLAGGASAALPWLSGKWCGANYDRDPTARATFGIFGPRKGTIYIRESY